jgi:lipopolysaccharide biosynthesis glycosyltransferase
MKREIPIFFTFDNNYVVPAAVAFYSLLRKAKDNIFYKMYILHSDITENSKNLLYEVIDGCKNASLEFRDTGEFLHSEWAHGNFDGHNNEGKTQFTCDVIVKCFASKFFPEFDKIIYSDVDVVFMDDISELYDVDLTDKYIAAVKNAFMKFDQKELSHLSADNYEKFKDSYFAGGIWVLNLENIRRDKIEKTMIEIINDDKIIKKWNDQDIMNISCNNKVEYISLRYISYPYILDRFFSDNFSSHFSKDEIVDSVILPKILHYAGLKPWNREVDCGEIWWNYFNVLNLPKTKIFESNDERLANAKVIHKVYYAIWLILNKILKRKRLI